ncbi:type VI secretion system baseplate subunit TssE [Burkholderia cepacia]|uniref:type VI secretion system baseplate subunit TssE n=1 Tax=Burkholderia cepacia TaxID=292 RepID=UPI001CF49B51|nr:type VI secretion system baseplate subunit TssE [Burkholderia cepacia]MCA7993974.1 type VI secretion system baseplate subunit TssE [Burkholderia cepacia]
MPRTLGQGSLFERLDPELAPRRLRTSQDLAAERIQAIKRHLEWVLNARQGCSSSSPELGLPDFNDVAVGSADLRHRLSEHIQAVVNEFEPRVKVTRVQPLMDAARPLDLHFRLHCLVPVRNAHESIELDLVLQHHNRAARFA